MTGYNLGTTVKMTLSCGCRHEVDIQLGTKKIKCPSFGCGKTTIMNVNDAGHGKIRVDIKAKRQIDPLVWLSGFVIVLLLINYGIQQI